MPDLPVEDVLSDLPPKTEVKLYVTAADATRAHRRWLELSARP